jgi:nucleotide-binding universal stress UspA family protein
MAGFRTIVAAIDFSEASRNALRGATELACEGDGALHLVHVVLTPVYSAWSVTAPDLEATGVHAAYVEDARRQLEELAATLAIERFRVTCAALPGWPGAEIVRYARAVDADLLVVGTQGHGIVSGVLLGSVAEEIVRHAPCPVLVVPRRTTATVAAA